MTQQERSTMSITRYEQVVTRIGNYIMPNPQGAWVRYDDHKAIYKTGCDMIAERDSRIAELEAVVSKLPKTADGVVVTPGMSVWVDRGSDVYEEDRYEEGAWWPDESCDIYGDGEYITLGNCYSTRAAALAAKGQP